MGYVVSYRGFMVITNSHTRLNSIDLITNNLLMSWIFYQCCSETNFGIFQIFLVWKYIIKTEPTWPFEDQFLARINVKYLFSYLKMVKVPSPRDSNPIVAPSSQTLVANFFFFWTAFLELKFARTSPKGSPGEKAQAVLQQRRSRKRVKGR